jgi:hypothetical protein
MHNTQSRLPVNDNDVITLGATIGRFEAVVFLTRTLLQARLIQDFLRYLHRAL